MLAEVSEKRSKVNLAGPSAVEENLFRQVLEHRRENLVSMRKPENYDLRLAKKGYAMMEAAKIMFSKSTP